ncbi:unnamed protein product [Pleuronectes platessa]|uniref:Uncharacterized protein n=1 Tax=Pleuronectes platessa TaxID=8262 RepID=A0A9N7VH04_PLEPL|nr:unnamed protein product [Pleuronectes platessa]
MSYDQLLKEEDLSEETRPNSVPRARRIRSISGPSMKPLQHMNQRYPARAMTSSPNSGDSLTACTPRNTTRDSLDFWKIRATRKQHREGHSKRLYCLGRD